MKTTVFIVFFAGGVSANAHLSSHLDTTGTSTMGVLFIMVAVLLVTISATPHLKKPAVECNKEAPEPPENHTDSAIRNVSG